MPPIFKRIEGRKGRIDIPFIGAVVGNIISFTLTRRADRGPEAEFYDFHAALSFISEALFNDDDYQKRVIVVVGKRPFRLDPAEGPGQRTALQGRSLVMERVALKDANENDARAP